MSRQYIPDLYPLSQKAINSIMNTELLTVWEGAVRSGKTVASILAWLVYIYESPGRYFIMSAKSIATLYRNVLGGDFGLLAFAGKAAEYKVDRDGNRVVLLQTPMGIKTIYCIGAHDEGSYTTLRGLTAHGWYADEINMQPRSFVEEAMRRTIVSPDRRMMWTLNPDNPHHWLYVEYLDHYEATNLKGFRIWFFTLDDNKALTEESKAELKNQFKGVFYRRYILGERCIAEGAIYDMFNEDNIFDDEDIPYQLRHQCIRYIAVDYGTTNPCVFLDCWDDGRTVWVMNEYRWDSKAEQFQKTDYQYADDLERFMGDDRCEIVMDPSAVSLRVECRNRLMVVKEADNDVRDGISAVSTMLGNKMLRFHRTKCRHTIGEVRGYAWNEKAALNGDEKPIKVDDHGPDAIRYLIKTRIPSWRTGVDSALE